MPRDNPKQLQQRTRIAQTAARLMAEHGIRDHALAKGKAARQLGLPASGGLPSNEEVDQALKAYQSLFEPETHELDLAAMRQQALAVMRTLARFDPVLTGGLVQGVASRFAPIEIEVYADSSKEFERFLLNHGIEFKAEERRSGSFFILYAQPADVSVRILPRQSAQSAPRLAGEARRRLNAEQLRQLIEAPPPEQGAQGAAGLGPSHPGANIN